MIDWLTLFSVSSLWWTWLPSTFWSSSFNRSFLSTSQNMRWVGNCSKTKWIWNKHNDLITFLKVYNSPCMPSWAADLLRAGRSCKPCWRHCLMYLVWIERVDQENFFSFSQYMKTWEHPVKLISCRFGMGKKKYYFTQIVNVMWNSLPVMAKEIKGVRFMEDTGHGDWILEPRGNLRKPLASVPC